jgi:WD40 repeat protein
MAIALSPDGKTLVSSSRDRTIRIWDLDAREEQFTISEPALIFTITLCPDTSIFITKSRDQVCKTWSLRNGQPIDTPWEELQTMRPRTIASVIQTHGNRLISGSQNTIRIWDLQQGKEECILRGHTSLVSAVASNPKPLLIASGSEDRTIKIWGV